jgi:stage V sporulation protein S
MYNQITVVLPIRAKAILRLASFRGGYRVLPATSYRKNTAMATQSHARSTNIGLLFSASIVVGKKLDQTCVEGGTAMEVIKVSAKSRSTAVAGAIASVVREQGRAEAQAIGAGAVNQAVKAVAIARGYLALDNLDVICIPAFVEVSIEGQERTALKLIVEPR